MPRGGLLTPDDLVTSITEGSDTDAKLVILHERLKSQAARLRTTTCTVLNGNPDRTDFADQSACDEYNNSMLDKFKLLHVFFERNLSTVAAFSTNIVNEATGVLTDEHRRLFVQVLNPNIYPFSSTMAGGIIRAQHLTMSFGGVTKTVAAHFAIKMIHVFATEYVNDNNGLQRLLERFSITNANNEVDIHPYDARNMMIEISHLHHWCAFDINSMNTIPENMLDNHARKRCGYKPYRICQCPTPCNSRHTLIAPQFFERYVKRYVVEIKGECEGMSEREIRVQLAVEFTRWLARNNITPEDDEFPDFLKLENRDDLLEPHFEEWAMLRSEITPPRGYVPGMTDPATAEKVTFKEVITGSDAPSNFYVPGGVLSQMRSQAEDITDVDTDVNELTEFGRNSVLEEQRIARLQKIQNDVNEKNVYTALRSIVAPTFLERYLNAYSWSADLGTQDEKDAGALHLTENLAQLAHDGQHVRFTFRDAWNGYNGATSAVNAWAKNTLGKDNYRPGLCRMTMHAAFIFDYWEAFDGNLENITKYLSILGVDDTVDSETAMAQIIEASHLHHQSLKDRHVMSEARDSNPSNMRLESMGDNRLRNICSVDPLLPSMGDCKCTTIETNKCAPVIFKLTEECMDRQTNLQIQLKASGIGRYVNQTNPQIRLDIIRKFRRAFQHNQGTVPDWLAARESVAGNEGFQLWQCPTCPNQYMTQEESNSCQCNAVAVAQAAPQDGDGKTLIRIVGEYNDEHLEELRNTIVEYGMNRHGCFAFLGKNMPNIKSPTKTIGNLLSPSKVNSRFVRWVRVNVVPTIWPNNENEWELRTSTYMGLLRGCDGRIKNCRCDLHNWHNELAA